MTDPLTPPREKKELLRAWGVDRVEVLPFDRELAALSAEDFVEHHLVKPLGVVRLVTGPDFALGRGRAGTVAHLAAIGQRRGFAVETVPLLLEHHGPVSSTRVRGALRGGDVEFAQELLGRPYSIEGRVVHGWGMGEKLAFPTANLDPLEPRFLPADGVYAGWVHVPGDERGPGPGGARRGAISLGLRPTFDGAERTLEVHLLDWENDLRDKTLRVEFMAWLRGQEKFDGAGPLVEAMGRDVERVRSVLQEEARGGG